METKRKLPIYMIAETAFIVDVEKDELRQKDKPQNCISFSEMGYHKLYYEFHYDLGTKNIAEALSNGTQFTCVPNLTELDPIGMAIKYGKTKAEVIGKMDVEVMVDQTQLGLREGGQLPVIEIAGHPFYVDIRMDMLRPKDDFLATGIRFSALDDYFIEEAKHYRVPYNPATHSFEEIDFENIKAIPKDIIVIEIPMERQLDPVAFARHYGYNLEHILRNNPIHMFRKAREISWDKTPIKQIIARNLKTDLEKNQTQSKPQRKRGRGI